MMNLPAISSGACILVKLYEKKFCFLLFFFQEEHLNCCVTTAPGGALAFARRGALLNWIIWNAIAIVVAVAVAVVAVVVVVALSVVVLVLVGRESVTSCTGKENRATICMATALTTVDDAAFS